MTRPRSGGLDYNRAKSRPMQFRFSERTREQLEDLSAVLDTSMSEVARVAIRELWAETVEQAAGKGKKL